jgi:diguanylate cyclase (GGDEF)-like protein
MGGEEFAVFFTGKNFEQSLLIAEQLRENVEETKFQFDGRQINVTISVGIAGGSGLSFVQLYQDADKMLYQAKAAGKNCVKPDPVCVA